MTTLASRRSIALLAARSLAAGIVATTLVSARAGDDDAAAAAATTRWRELLDAPLEAVVRRDLGWITSVRDDAIAELADEAARTRIAELVAQQRERPVLEVDVPVDRTVAYEGYRPGNEATGLAAVHAPGADLKRPYHVWRSGRWSVLTATDGRREQLFVAAVFRAVAILRVRYPAIHEALFGEPRAPAAQLARIRARAPDKAVHFINRTVHHAVILDGGFDAIAKSRYELGSRRAADPAREGEADAALAGVDIFDNVAVTWVNRAGIEGWRAENIYGEGPPLRAWLRYLRDGLVETLVHEGLHHLLRRDKNVRELFWAIVETVPATFGGKTAKTCEEAFVANVSAGIFEEAGGISKEVTGYYRRLFRSQHVARLGLDAERPSDRAIALRAILERRTERGAETLEDLLSFDPTD